MFTTHTGSLPVTAAGTVEDLVRRQVQTGIDVINDGELPKRSVGGYAGYITNRLTGFGGDGEDVEPPSDVAEFPTYRERLYGSSNPFQMPACIGDVVVSDPNAVVRDIRNLKTALQSVSARDVFMTAASPGVISRYFANRHYPTDEAYLFALADAMNHEYRAIVEAGFVLQLDCPDLAMGRTTKWATLSDAQFHDLITLHVEALNRAVAGLPPGRMRMHVCWGNYEGPHHHDVPIASILEVLLKATPAGLSFEAANPRHAHEWRAFETVDLPSEKVLIPGVIDSTTNYIEHPQLVADRLTAFVRIVGPERVVAGVDCGFAAAVKGVPLVDPEIAWAKLRSLVEGVGLINGG